MLLLTLSILSITSANTQISLQNRIRLVNSSKLDLETQFYLVKDSHPHIRLLLAKRKVIQESVLKILHTDSKKIQTAVNNHPIIRNIEEI